MPTIELGLDTFGDVTGGRRRPPPPARPGPPQCGRRGRAGRQAWAWTSSASASTTAPTSPSAPPRSCSPRSPPGLSRIRLGTAVTVLSTDDPVRVYQRFSTLDAVSNGRAEVILGRGSFTESFPLFGYSLDDYDDLFEQKLAIFAALRDADRTGEPVHWKGTVRSPLEGVRIYPPVEHPPLRTWVGVGGSPESVVRAARYRFPLTLAIIGGDPRRFAPYVELYHRALDQLGSEPLPVGVHSPGHIAETDEQAREELWEPYRVMRNRIGAERGWGPTSRAEFDREVAEGSLYVGSPETVARKIAATARALGASRFDLKYSAGTLRHELMLRSIELYGREVIPRVRRLLAERRRGGRGLNPPGVSGRATPSCPRCCRSSRPYPRRCSCPP